MNITEAEIEEIEDAAASALEGEIEARNSRGEGMPVDEAAFFVARFTVNATLARVGGR